MLVEFVRVRTRMSEEFGEDDTDGNATQTPLAIGINPIYVAAVFDSRNEGTSIIRLSDGRGFIVEGNSSAVMERLRSAGRSTATEEA